MSGLRNFLSKPRNQVVAFLLIAFSSYFFFSRPIEFAQDVQVVGNRAYLATGLDGLRIIDVSDLENPQEIGYFNAPGEVKAVFVKDERAYLACGRSGLVIVDIRDPKNIRRLGAYNTKGFAEDVVVVEQRAYVSDRKSGIVVLNIHHPQSIKEISSAHLDVFPGKMQVEGSQLYFVHKGSQIQVADISVLNESKLSTALEINSPIRHLSVQGGFVYLATDSGLVVVDYTDLQAPQEVASFPIAGGLLDIFVQDQVGYAVDGNGIRLLDFSHAPAIHEIGSKSTLGKANAIFVNKSIAYICDGFNGLVVHGARILVSPDEDTLRYSSPQINSEGVTKAGKHLFVAASEQGVRILDVSDPANPRFVKSVDTPGIARQVTVVADRAFVADGPGGMLTLDISKLEETSIPTDAMKIGEDSYASLFANELIFLADGKAGVKLIGFPQTLEPTLIGQVPVPGIAQDLALYGDTIYVAAGKGGLWIVGTSSFSALNLLANYQVPQGDAKSLVIHAINPKAASQPELDPFLVNPGDPAIKVYALIAYGPAGLQILDVTNPFAIQWVGAYTAGGSIEAVRVERERAYLANSNGSLHILDITNLSQPRLVGVFGTPGQARDLALDGDTLFVADYERGVRILNVADAEQPKEIGFFDAPAYVNFVAAPKQGNHAYILDGRQGMWVLDTVSAKGLTEIGAYTSSGIANSVTQVDDFLYLADGPAGVKILNIADPRGPELVSLFDTPGEANAVVADQRILYVADGSKGLRVYDQSNLAMVREISAYPIAGNARRLALQNDYAFVASREGGLVILKVTDPSQPAKVSEYTFLRDVRDVWVSGNYAYLAAGVDGFRVLDISHPLQPREVFVNFAASPAEDIQLIDQYAFIASGKQGVRIFDITDPEKPVEAGLFTGAKNALSLATLWLEKDSAQGKYGYYRIHIADAENRLAVLEANKSLAITLSGVYQTPGTADLAQITQFLLGGLENRSDPAMEKAARTINQFLFDVLVLGIVGFVLWAGIFSQYVLPIQSGGDRLKIFERLLLFMSGKHGMAIQVKEGRSIQHSNEENRRGSGVILIDSSSAAVLERRELPYGPLMVGILRFAYFSLGYLRGVFGHKKEVEHIPHFRILGPGLNFTLSKGFPSLPKWDERLHAVADLRPQVRARKDVQGYTSEGIEINTSIAVVFTIGQNPEVLSVTYEGDETAENLRVIQIEQKPLNAEQAADGRAGIRKVVQSLKDSLDTEDKQEIHLYLRGKILGPESENGDEIPPADPSIPFVYDPERIFAALISRAHDLEDGKFMDWTELPTEVATEVFRNVLATFKYDDLYRPEDPKVLQLQALRGQLNTQVRNLGVLGFQFVRRIDGLPIKSGQIWNKDELQILPNRVFRTPKILRRRGIKVLSANFSEMKPDNELVRQKLFDFWSSSWQKEAEALRSEHSLQAVRITNQARLEAQREMASYLSRILSDAPEEALALRVFQALESAAADPATRQLLPSDTINMLRNLYNLYFPSGSQRGSDGPREPLTPGDSDNSD